MRSVIALLFLGIVAGACGGTSTVTTLAPTTETSSGVTPDTTSTTQPATTTTTLPLADAGADMLALIQADEFAGTFNIAGSVTIATSEIGFSGEISGDADSSTSSLLFGPPLDSLIETITITGVLYERYDGGAWLQSLEADSEDGLQEYFDRIDTLTDAGETSFLDRQVLAFSPNVAPTVDELGFDGFAGQPEVQFLTELDGTPLQIRINLDGIFENSVGLINYEMTLSDIGSDHQVELPTEFLIKYTSPQEIPFSVGYPANWTEEGGTLAVVFTGTIGEEVDFTSYLFGSETFTLDEWAEITIALIEEDPEMSITSDQTIPVGPDARIWRIVEGTAETEFESLYLVYATALVDGGAIDVIGFYPPGFEALDFSTLLDMMATFEPVQ